ncbi:MAG: hydrogenase large subunit [Motilibacteraceae bacterium]
MTSPALTDLADVASWRHAVLRRVDRGERFAGLFATADGPSTRLTAALARPGRLDLMDTTLAPGAVDYPALSTEVPAAFWYEREIHDLFGLVPRGHPRLDPLVLPLDPGAARPRPGSAGAPTHLVPHEHPLPAHLAGTGVFTLPHGPVRSGVSESVEFLLETPGEDIPHLRVRPHHKHRGLAKGFEGLSPEHGLLLAERVEGVASVAHALAFAHAVEDLAGTQVSAQASLVRLVHAELERIANHLDVAMRLADAAALAVATARFGWHKERIMRLRGQLCGHRFGRSVVAVGGVQPGSLATSRESVGAALDAIERDVTGDERAAMATPSFLDRLRGTGRLPGEVAVPFGALGPVGRASSGGEDVRASRPYGAYRQLHVVVAAGDAGDVQERLRVRWAELHESFRLIRLALDDLSAGAAPAPPLARPPAPEPPPDGRGVGWAEAPQGEVLYLVEVCAGRLARVAARSASFHDLPLFHRVFGGDIFTDFPFIEASFGLSVAGVAG